MDLLHDRRDRLADDAAVAATIGVFDGVHLGHQEVFRQVRAAADRSGPFGGCDLRRPSGPCGPSGERAEAAHHARPETRAD